MGRHSRKGRAKAADTSERTVKRGDAPPSYGMAQGDTAIRPGPLPSDPLSSDPRDAAPGGPPRREGGYGPAGPSRPPVRGGHPEQREPGGAWGADPGGRGPGPGHTTGRVLQGAPGVRGPGQAPGPRQDYLDAFDDDVFGANSSLRAPSPRHPVRGHGPPPGGPGARRPGTPGPWNGYGQTAGHGRAPGQAESGPPWQEYEQEREYAQEPRAAERGLPSAPRFPAPEQQPGTKQRGRGRTFTGVAAAAVTTVLAVVIGGQVAGGDNPDGGAAGSADAARGDSGGAASRSEDDGRGAPGKPRVAPLSYAEKMAKPLPLDADFRGKGGFSAVKGQEKGAGGGRVLRYRVDIEKGLPLESGLFADAVHKTLNDKRSWAHSGERSFERVDGGDADFVITLASSRTTDVWCAKSGLDTSEDKVSCDSASTDRIMINAYRWAQGAKTFGDSRMYAYRQMLINHEVGHRIGFDHVGCSKDGALAPVMMQQTKTLKSGEATCRPNAWPHPRA